LSGDVGRRFLVTMCGYTLPMLTSDHEIERLAQIVVQRVGEGAAEQARKLVEAMRRQGYHDEADTWLRVIVAIDALGTAPSSPRPWVRAAYAADAPTCD
jgi:hypothetical protein